MSVPIEEEEFARKTESVEDAGSSDQKKTANCKFFLQVQPSDTSRSEDDDEEQCVRTSKRNGTTNLKMNSLNARDRWGRLKTTMAVTNNITVKKKGRLDRGDSFLRKFSTRNQEGVKEPSESDNPASNDIHHVKHRTLGSYVIHPAGAIMFYWLGVVTVAVLYNLWTCIAREAFREIQEGYMVMWFCFDGVCDFVYVCDILVQFRTGYLQQGLMVYDSSKLCQNYVKHRCFLVDLACLVPLDFLQFYTGIHPMLRFPRFLKLYRGVTFMHMYESRTAYPNLLRVLNLSHILFLGSHWFAAFYYLISESEGFNGDWSYPKPDGIYSSVTRKYLASLYWSTLTLTTIGDLPQPDTNWQYVFVIVSYLIGVFIFATIVGQVGNVITNRNASRQEFERLLDGAKFYMQMHNVPTDLQKRVQRWYDYVWTRGRLNCNDINSLGLLPDKLKTELALHVNLGTLKKVTIFQKCRPEFLHDLMLKMRAYIFTPGDLICRRGEVAREMFIIADGVVEILGENATVLTQMSTGDFFGEIGILNLDGGINRRTADVRSVGYSELFVLSREDVLAALKDHPDAEQIIREYGQRRLKETEQHRKLAKSVPSSPEPNTYRSTRSSNKSSKHVNNSPSLNLPQVKYLQKLPHMSPKLRKVFNLKNRRKDPSRGKLEKCVEHVKSEKNGSNNENDKMNIYTIERDQTVPSSQLNTIQEGNVHVDQATPSDPGNGSCNIASVVINLLKQRRQIGYTAVDTDENSDVFSEIKIENIGDVTSDANSRKGMDVGHDSSAVNDSCKTVTNSGFQTCATGDSMSGLNIDQEVRQPEPKTLFLPKIVLTKDSHHVSSASASSSNSGTEEAADENRPPTPHPQHRDHITRKSSPCVLTLEPKLSDSKNRRISCPPPLDLPIPVPPFSNFRGMAQNEVTFALDRFQETLERRMERLESSYRDTVIKLEDSAKSQEQLIKVILQKLSLPSDKRKDTAGVNTSLSEEHGSSNKVIPDFIRRKSPISSTPRLSKSSKLNCPSMHMSLDCSTNSSPILKHRSLSVDDDAFEDSTVICSPPKSPRDDKPRSRTDARSRNHSDRSDTPSVLANEGAPISDVSDNGESKLEDNLEHITETEHISDDETKVTHL